MIGDTMLAPGETRYQEQVRHFLARNLDPTLVECMDRNEVTYPKDFIRLMASQRYLGACIPSEYNGGGRSILEDALVNEEVGFFGSAALACARTFTSHVGWILYRYGSGHIKEGYLKPMLAGEKITAQAMTEPTAGSDLAAVRTTARRSGDRYIVRGEKRFIDGALDADFMAVAVRSGNSDDPRRSLSVLLVDTKSPGYLVKEVHGNWHGFRGLGSAWIVFDDVEVPLDNLLGEENEGWRYLMEELQVERVVATRAQLGQARRALQIAANYAGQRTAFGKKLREHQHIAFKIAEMATKLDAAALLDTRAARLLDAGRFQEARMEVAMAKWFGAQYAWEVADDALQILGGIGYTQKYPVERILRDVRAARLTAGSSEMMALIIQRRAFEKLHDPNFPAERVGAELDR